MLILIQKQPAHLYASHSFIFSLGTFKLGIYSSLALILREITNNGGDEETRRGD